MCDGFCSHHGTHVGTTGGITNHSGAATNQRNGFVTSHLQTLHQAKRHKMAYMQGICCGIKANIESGLAIIDHLSDFFFIGNLGNQATGNQFIIKLNFKILP